MPIDLQPVVMHLPAWGLVLFRLTGIFIFAPVFGSSAVPGRVKLFLALGLSFCIYPMLLHPSSGAASGIITLLGSGFHLWSLPVAVAMELLIGLVIGYAASLPMIALQLGGRAIDQQMGLGFAGVVNPEFNEQTGVVSEFYFVLAMAVFLILGGHRVLLITLVGSFERIPLGGFVPNGHLLSLVIGMLSTVFDLAMRVSAPVLCLIFLETVAMGFIARTVPQMNILSIGFPVRIIMGAVLLIAIMGLTTQLGARALQDTLEQLMRFFALPPRGTLTG